MGCCCRRNITFGYELLVNSESSHNAFRLIMCCGIDMERLDGKQYIFSCKSNSGITIVCLSVYNHTWLSCLLAKMSISIHAFMHAICSAFVTSKPFWLVLIYLFCIGVVFDFAFNLHTRRRTKGAGVHPYPSWCITLEWTSETQERVSIFLIVCSHKCSNRASSDLSSQRERDIFKSIHFILLARPLIIISFLWLTTVSSLYIKI